MGFRNTSAWQCLCHNAKWHKMYGIIRCTVGWCILACKKNHAGQILPPQGLVSSAWYSWLTCEVSAWLDNIYRSPQHALFLYFVYVGDCAYLVCMASSSVHPKNWLLGKSLCQLSPARLQHGLDVLQLVNFHHFKEGNPLPESHIEVNLTSCLTFKSKFFDILIEWGSTKAKIFLIKHPTKWTDGELLESGVQTVCCKWRSRTRDKPLRKIQQNFEERWRTEAVCFQLVASHRKKFPSASKACLMS